MKLKPGINKNNVAKESLNIWKLSNILIWPVDQRRNHQKKLENIQTEY